jgi:hypothetical protein
VRKDPRNEGRVYSLVTKGPRWLLTVGGKTGPLFFSNSGRWPPPVEMKATGDGDTTITVRVIRRSSFFVAGTRETHCLGTSKDTRQDVANCVVEQRRVSRCTIELTPLEAFSANQQESLYTTITTAAIEGVVGWLGYEPASQAASQAPSPLNLMVLKCAVDTGGVRGGSAACTVCNKLSALLGVQAARVLNEETIQYGEAEYWDQRYLDESYEPYDWLVQWRHVQHFIGTFVGHGDRILQAGQMSTHPQPHAPSPHTRAQSCMLRATATCRSSTTVPRLNAVLLCCWYLHVHCTTHSFTWSLSCHSTIRPSRLWRRPLLKPHVRCWIPPPSQH